MTKEQRIEEMVNDIPEWARYGASVCQISDKQKKAVANELVQKVYGNLREFAEKLKENNHIKLDEDSFVLIRFKDIDELLKECEG